MRYRVLGSLEVQGTHGPVRISSNRQRIILLMFLMESNRVVPVDRLIDAVWDRSPPVTARGQVQICVSQLRKLLADGRRQHDAIDTSSSGYLLRIGEDELDVHVFEQLTRAARKAAGEGRHIDSDDNYAKALALWRSDDIDTCGSAALRSVAARLGEQRMAVIEEWADARLRVGMHHELAVHLLDLVPRFPLREQLRAKLMLALYRCGRQAEALEVYRAGRRVLVDELGVEPGEELRRLELGILCGNAQLEQEGCALVSDPPAAAVSPVPRTLPGNIADFTGHAQLVEQITGDIRAVRGDSLPLVFVSGKAGVGKTTIAVRAAHEVAADYPDGQLFVRLGGQGAESTTPLQALERFLRALGVPGTSVPETLEGRADLFRSLVADRKVLVVLDEAGDEETVCHLLPGNAQCAVIVTSRIRLTGLSGEHVEVGVMPNEEALGLLVRIVGKARVFAEIAEALKIVAFCGGLPLALRIAAARLAAHPHWSLADFVGRLTDESRRLDELVYRGLGVRAALASTYDALTEPAKRLFRRLGMVETAEFAGWLAAPLLDTTARQAEEALDELVDAQFVDVDRARGGGSIRFKLHALVRTYSRERLAVDEDPAERAAAMTRMLGSWLFLTEEATAGWTAATTHAFRLSARTTAS